MVNQGTWYGSEAKCDDLYQSQRRGLHLRVNLAEVG
jgi:hypothetical protein